MSVNALQRPAYPITITDELESFFYVLLYFSVRFLKSSCLDPLSWIDSYFHNYSGPDCMFTCGQKSIAMEVTGKLETLVPPGPLLFNSPIDGILSELLRCFRAHYKVVSHDRRKAMFPSEVRQEPKPQNASPVFLEPTIPPRRGKLTESEVALRAELRKKFEKPTPPDNTPSPEERALAAKVADHTFMLELLERVLQEASWPDDDRILPAQPLQPAPAQPPLPKANHAPPRKRQKKATPSRNATLPTRPCASTRRTRSQARGVPARARSNS